MPKQKARITLWEIERRQFAFWFAAALVGGAVPELLLLAGNWFLVAGWILAISIAFRIWQTNHRRVGIGVFIHLPDSLAEDSPPELLSDVQKWMITKHRDWFRSGPESLYQINEAANRADWAIATIRHRLSEVELSSGKDSPLYFYLYCRQEESFNLGSRASMIINREISALPDSDGGKQSPQIRLASTVRYLSTYKSSEGEYYELDLSKIEEKPTSTHALTEKYDLKSEHPSAKLDNVNRLAVIIYADKNEDISQIFKANALEAASGVKGNGYPIKNDDKCDKALYFFISPTHLNKSLKDGSAHGFIQDINVAWRTNAKEWYGSDDVQVRVFIKGPSILAFAAGALFPSGSKLVPWDKTLIVDDIATEKNSTHELVAIVDGDDVGAEMERHLLARQLDQVVEYSSSVDSKLKSIIGDLAAVSGVELLASGGDSAIFGMSRSSVKNFTAKLESSRQLHNFRLSCGYGKDTQQAYLALRAAKTSGKNITQEA